MVEKYQSTLNEYESKTTLIKNVHLFKSGCPQKSDNKWPNLKNRVLSCTVYSTNSYVCLFLRK